MEQFLGLDSWGTDLILWIQSWQSPALDALASATTQLGYEPTYLLLLTLVFWCINRSWGLRAFVLVALSTGINEAAKNLFKSPRPDSAIVRVLDPSFGYGLPSNHAQTVAVLWGYLASKMRKTWFTLLAVLITLAVGLSRMYLGSHYPQDVLGGWFLALVILLLTWRFEEPIVSWWNGLSVSRQALMATAVALIILLISPADVDGHYPARTSASMSGLILGVSLGHLLETRTVRFRVEGPIVRRIVRYLLGIIIILAVYIPGTLIPDLEPWPLEVVVRILRYAAVGAAAAWLAPWSFVKLHLAEQAP